MPARSREQTTARWLAAGAGLGMAAYASYAAFAWLKYGDPSPPSDAERDVLLDRFMPTYDIVERHHTFVGAPAEITLAAAKEQEPLRSGLVRAIFRAREIAMGATPPVTPQPRGLLESVQALGWGVLADVPGREIVLGAITRPWEANVTFRGLPPAGFASFWEPGYVKIAWTLRADPVDQGRSVFRTETRAVATDEHAGVLFRRYWALVSPGVVAIRYLSLRPLRREAERRARQP